MTRLFCAVLVWVMAVSCAAFAAVSPDSRVILTPRQEVPTYQSLKMARKGTNPTMVEGPAQIVAVWSWNRDYQVFERKDGWLRLRENEKSDEPFWVAQANVLPTGAFLADPAYEDITMTCPDDWPTRFVASLDAAHKDMVIRIRKKPGLNGGFGELQVWDGQEKTLLWSAQARTDEMEFFSCYMNSPTWPRIVGDVNGDGKAEILYTSFDPRGEPASGPFPTLHILSWDGKAFVPSGDVILAVNAKTMPDSAPLLEMRPDVAEEVESRLYLAELLEMRDDGSFTATITHEFPNSAGADKEGIAILRLSGDNKTFIFKGWASVPQ